MASLAFGPVFYPSLDRPLLRLSSDEASFRLHY